MTTIATSQMAGELRLKLGLAKLLPDEIMFTGINFLWMRGAYSGQVVRDTEWEYVVRRVTASDEFGPYSSDAWTHEAEALLERRGIEW